MQVKLYKTYHHCCCSYSHYCWQVWLDSVGILRVLRDTAGTTQLRGYWNVYSDVLASHQFWRFDVCNYTQLVTTHCRYTECQSAKPDQLQDRTSCRRLDHNHCKHGNIISLKTKNGKVTKCYLYGKFYGSFFCCCQKREVRAQEQKLENPESQTRVAYHNIWTSHDSVSSAASVTASSMLQKC